jgi:hypothetical protein
VIHRIHRAVHGTAVVTAAFVALALVPTAVGATGAKGDPLGEENEKGAHCFIDKDDTLSPGVSLQPSSGTAATPAPGIIECHGKVNGFAPTGDGQVTEQARYGTKDPDTCQSGGEGDGQYVVTIPTSGGVQKFVAVFTFTYGEPSTHGGVVAGRVKGDGFQGTFDITPKEGDCVTRPVTRVHTVNDLRFEDSFFAHS